MTELPRLNPPAGEWVNTDEAHELVRYFDRVLNQTLDISLSSEQLDIIEKCLRKQYGGSEIYIRKTPPINDDAMSNYVRYRLSEFMRELTQTTGTDEMRIRRFIKGHPASARTVSAAQHSLFTRNID